MLADVASPFTSPRQSHLATGAVVLLGRRSSHN